LSNLAVNLQEVVEVRLELEELAAEHLPPEFVVEGLAPEAFLEELLQVAYQLEQR
tara:strand:- start:228 stop:392 length:165 start_codon:yes stop_codon:yes gene_type:complete